MKTLKDISPIYWFFSVLLLALQLMFQSAGNAADPAPSGFDDNYKLLHPDSRLTGSYGFIATGYFAANFDTVTQTTTGAVAERIGVYHFDGQGHCKIHSLANKAGLPEAVIQGTDDCTYKVFADGTGTVDATLGGKSFLTAFVLVNGDTEFMFTRREGTNNPASQGGASLIFAIAKKQ